MQGERAVVLQAVNETVRMRRVAPLLPRVGREEDILHVSAELPAVPVQHVAGTRILDILGLDEDLRLVPLLGREQEDVVIVVNSGEGAIRSCRSAGGWVKQMSAK